MARCDKEEVPDQPLYIDEMDECVKCSWCPPWKGSRMAKVINQHMRKSVSHSKARNKSLNIEDPSTQGVQQDIRTFLTGNK